MYDKEEECDDDNAGSDVDDLEDVEKDEFAVES